jgi:hypothetical protein
MLPLVLMLPATIWLDRGATCTKVTYPKLDVPAMMGLRPAVSLTRK